MLWHSYYLHGAVTHDSFQDEHIVDQGTQYRYVSGFQGAARDPVQHVLPLIETRPDLARSVIRMTLKSMFRGFTRNVEPDHPAALPYALYGRGIIADGRYNPMMTGAMRSGQHGGVDANVTAGAGSAAIRPDDMELYLLLCAAEYLLATKDLAFLDETVSFFDRQGPGRTVKAGLLEALRFVTDAVGLGPHGLLRELTSDWDDGIAVRPDFPNNFTISESVLTSALATHSLARFGAALRLAGDEQNATVAEAMARKLRTAIIDQAFNGKWLRRAWFGPETGWIGDRGPTALHAPGVFSAQHGWAMLGGSFDDAPAALNASLVSLQAHCREGWRFGYAYICSRGPTTAGNDAATGRRLQQYPNAPGMWPAVNHPTVLGLLAVNRTELAWTEFERNTLDWQARVSPDIWTGIWTGSDSVDDSGLPSEWTFSFPALCVHRHAWPLFSLRHLAGIHYTADGILLRPGGVPARLGSYSWSTPLSAIAWDEDRLEWSGHYSCAQTPPTAAARAATTSCNVAVQVDLSLVIERLSPEPPSSGQRRAVRLQLWTNTGTSLLADVVTEGPSVIAPVVVDARGLRFSVRLVAA